MYSINGIALDSPSRDWKLLAPSKPISGIERRIASLPVPGRHGAIAQPATFGSIMVMLVVGTSRAGLEALYALFAQPTIRLSLTSTPAKEAVATLASVDYEGYGPGEELIDARFTLRLDAPFWRDATTTTSAAAAIGSASVVASVMAGMSAPVQDSIIRVKGTTGLRVTDSGGAWFEYLPAIGTSNYLRFHSDTGRAFITNTDTWTGGTEVSGVVDFVTASGGPFEIAPYFTDPATRTGRLTVTTTARSAATIEVRGKAAYLL